MKNLKISHKISILMFALLGIIILSNAFQIFQTSRINKESEIIAEEWLPSVEDTAAMNTALADMRVVQYAQLTSADDAGRVKADEERSKYTADMQDSMKKYETDIENDKERALYAAFVKNWDEYLAVAKRVDELFDIGQRDEANDLMNGEARSVYEKTSKSMDALLQYNTAGATAESDLAEKFYHQTLITSIALLALVFMMAMAAGYMIVHNVAKPIVKMTNYMGLLAAGDYIKDVPDRDRKDEVGLMAQSIQVFKDGMVRAKTLEAEQEKERLAKEVRQKNVDKAVKKFELTMADIVKFVASASAELQASAQSLAASAEETSKQSGAVAAASQQAAANVQTVASATEELSSSINEISSQVSRSSQVANKAVLDAEKAGKSVSELVEAAQKIGDVTKIISEIAEQTNLLALNATIEAARAGEAGKGFAVVASEVKNLATESTKATEEIAAQISNIQHISQTSAEAINMICRVIREIDEISGTISAAIQEQTSATQEISRNVTEAYTGTSEVTQNIGTVSAAANDTGSASHQVLSAADELARQSTNLKEQFDIFMQELDAA